MQFARIAIAAVFLGGSVANAQQTGELYVEGRMQACGTGPITKIFGQAPWLVFSCDDGRTVHIMPAPGNPITTWVFVLARDGDRPRLEGDGRGNKEITASAYDALSELSQRDLETLIQQTKSR